MDTYYGVIYFRDGHKQETGGFSGPVQNNLAKDIPLWNSKQQ